jgi:hypothetical protein
MFKVPLKNGNENSPKQVERETDSAVKKKILELRAVDEDRCVQLVDLYEEDLEPYQPTKNFTSTLYHYQALALAWMLRREGQGEQKED